MADFDPEKESQRFRTALDGLVERLTEDRNILAAVMVGSLDPEIIWRRQTVSLWLIESDGVTRRLISDGEDERIFRTLVEEDILFHCELIPRSRFKRMLEGSSRTAFSCNFFARRELLFSHDPSISTWFEQANDQATKDQEKELLATSTWAIYSLRHARRLWERKNDLTKTAQELIGVAHALAAALIVEEGEIYEKQLIYRALERRPEFFTTVYQKVVDEPNSEEVLSRALQTCEKHLEDNALRLFKPLLNHLGKKREAVPFSLLCDHFAYTQLYPWHLEAACEFLHRLGIVEKLSAPYKLTKKSRTEVEEPAYYYRPE
jgi:hypothetical protein